MKHVNQFSSWL